jgi:antirestriction protein ArdC
VPGILSSAYNAFHNYSIGNQMAAMQQCIQRGIDPAQIATYVDWKKHGRQVKKGEKAMTLCMPVSFKVEVENKQTGQTEQQQRSAFVWKNNWFVLSQTEGIDYANEVKTPEW